jgi:hypothetical protein
MAEAGEEIIVSESGNATEYEIEHDDSIRTESLHSLQFSADNSQDAIYSGTSDIRTMKSIEIAKELTMGCPFALVG